MLHCTSHLLRLFALIVLVGVVVDAGHPAAAAPLAKPAAAPAESSFGLNTHLATRFPTFGKLSQPAGEVARLGAGWAREDFAWPRIEPRQGTWDWGFTDEMVTEHSARGVQILGRLGYSVGWATADQSDSPNGQSFAMPDLEAWSRYVGATAARYRGRVRYWEVWNEPDNPIYWHGGPNPEAYARLLRAARDAIKAVDPAAVVLIGGVSPFDTSFLDGIARAGAWDAFDVLAIHPYTDPNSPEQGQIGPSGVGGVRALLNRHGAKPIWATEFGWESAASQRNRGGVVNEDQQANYLVRGYMELLAEPGLEKAFWYTLHDDPDSPFGLVRFGSGYADYSSRKPSFNAFTTMARELAGARFTGTVDLSAGRQVVESWDGAASWVLAGPQNGSLQNSGDRARSGGRAGRYDYRFPSGGNDYVAFRPAAPLSLGTPSSVGLWVSGDNSGHLLQIQLEDQSGELLQFPLGKVGGADWSWMQTSVSGAAADGNRLGGGDNNGRLDGPVRVRALVIDDQPNEYSGAGTIWIDDLTAINGAEVYDFRWQRGGETIDVVFAPNGASVRIPTASATATVVDRDGGRTEVAASGGALTLWADGRPRYIHHVPGTLQPQAPPTPPRPRDNGAFVTAEPDGAFAGVWDRSDSVVASGQTSRSWTWGPQAFATGREAYAEAPGGQRLVQYWDKSRMEISAPGANRGDLWFVTNGLLTKELIGGRLQTGNGTFVDTEPAQVPIAGDPESDTAPTYASFNALASLDGDRRSAPAVGAVVVERIERNGAVAADERMRSYGIQIGAYDGNLGHNIPAVFTDYFRTMPLDWVFVLGYPISEPYWATVNVGGQAKDVLIQVFERRALTYTPGNGPAFRVEMGNVGQHYFRWRYGATPWQQ